MFSVKANGFCDFLYFPRSAGKSGIDPPKLGASLLGSVAAHVALRPRPLQLHTEAVTLPEVWTITFARDLAVAGPGRAILTKGKPKFRRGRKRHGGMGCAGGAAIDPPVE